MSYALSGAGQLGSNFSIQKAQKLAENDIYKYSYKIGNVKYMQVLDENNSVNQEYFKEYKYDVLHDNEGNIYLTPAMKEIWEGIPQEIREAIIKHELLEMYGNERNGNKPMTHEQALQADPDNAYIIRNLNLLLNNNDIDINEIVKNQDDNQLILILLNKDEQEVKKIIENEKIKKISQALSNFTNITYFDPDSHEEPKTIEKLIKALDVSHEKGLRGYEISLCEILPPQNKLERFGLKDIKTRFWVQQINPEQTIEIMESIKSMFREKADEIKAICQLKNLELSVHLYGITMPAIDPMTKELIMTIAYPGFNETMGKFFQLQLEIAEMIGSKNVTVHLVNENLGGYVGFVKEAAKKNIKVNFENNFKVNYKAFPEDPYDKMLLEGFIGVDDFITAMSYIKSKLTPQEQEFLGVTLDTSRALNSYTKTLPISASSEAITIERKKINLENLEQYFFKIENAGLSINQIHLAQFDTVNNKEQKIKTQPESKLVFYNKTKISATTVNPNLDIYKFLFFLMEKNYTGFLNQEIPKTEDILQPSTPHMNKLSASDYSSSSNSNSVSNFNDIVEILESSGKTMFDIVNTFFSNENNLIWNELLKLANNLEYLRTLFNSLVNILTLGFLLQFFREQEKIVKSKSKLETIDKFFEHFYIYIFNFFLDIDSKNVSTASVKLNPVYLLKTITELMQKNKTIYTKFKVDINNISDILKVLFIKNEPSLNYITKFYKDIYLKITNPTAFLYLVDFLLSKGTEKKYFSDFSKFVTSKQTYPTKMSEKIKYIDKDIDSKLRAMISDFDSDKFWNIVDFNVNNKSLYSFYSYIKNNYFLYILMSEMAMAKKSIIVKPMDTTMDDFFSTFNNFVSSENFSFLKRIASNSKYSLILKEYIINKDSKESTKLYKLIIQKGWIYNSYFNKKIDEYITDASIFVLVLNYLDSAPQNIDEIKKLLNNDSINEAKKIDEFFNIILNSLNIPLIENREPELLRVPSLLPSTSISSNSSLQKENNQKQKDAENIYNALTDFFLKHGAESETDNLWNIFINIHPKAFKEKIIPYLNVYIIPFLIDFIKINEGNEYDFIKDNEYKISIFIDLLIEYIKQKIGEANIKKFETSYNKKINKNTQPEELLEFFEIIINNSLKKKGEENSLTNIIKFYTAIDSKLLVDLDYFYTGIKIGLKYKLVDLFNGIKKNNIENYICNPYMYILFLKWINNFNMETYESLLKKNELKAEDLVVDFFRFILTYEEQKTTPYLLLRNIIKQNEAEFDLSNFNFNDERQTVSDHNKNDFIVALQDITIESFEQVFNFLGLLKTAYDMDMDMNPNDNEIPFKRAIIIVSFKKNNPYNKTSYRFILEEISLYLLTQHSKLFTPIPFFSSISSITTVPSITKNNINETPPIIMKQNYAFYKINKQLQIPQAEDGTTMWEVIISYLENADNPLYLIFYNNAKILKPIFNQLIDIRSIGSFIGFIKHINYFNPSFLTSFNLDFFIIQFFRYIFKCLDYDYKESALYILDASSFIKIMDSIFGKSPTLINIIRKLKFDLEDFFLNDSNTSSMINNSLINPSLYIYFIDFLQSADISSFKSYDLFINNFYNFVLQQQKPPTTMSEKVIEILKFLKKEEFINFISDKDFFYERINQEISNENIYPFIDTINNFLSGTLNLLFQNNIITTEVFLKNFYFTLTNRDIKIDSKDYLEVFTYYLNNLYFLYDSNMIHIINNIDILKKWVQNTYFKELIKKYIKDETFLYLLLLYIKFEKRLFLAVSELTIAVQMELFFHNFFKMVKNDLKYNPNVEIARTKIFSSIESNLLNSFITFRDSSYFSSYSRFYSRSLLDFPSYIQRNNNNKLPSSMATKTFEITGNGGIVNAGNTCFMNASLQLLYRVPAIRDFLLQDS
ncbi:MAG: ubiquitin carboxyl-terminal hydrolase, partial [Elusimicrobiota bacterium]|nr:ubiquitin carboxyl-terminal hydrolase [Elusimicrobiota bacterium]